MKTDIPQGTLNFWICHELLPYEARTGVFKADHDLTLIQTHIDLLEPVLGLIESVMHPVRAPDFGPQIAIKVFERGLGFIGRVRKDAERGRTTNRPVVI